MSEVVSHNNNHASEIIEYLHSQEQLSDPAQRRDYFEHLDGDDFIGLVQQTAGLVRTGQPDMQHFDGDSAGLMLHEVPDQREKELLLHETWTVAKDFLSNPELSDEDALDYAAMTVAGGLLYAHPFVDGNGRTSRAITYMMARGNGNEKELSDILANSDGGGNWQVTPIPLTVDEKQAFKGPQPGRIEWEFAFAGEGVDELGGVIANSKFKGMILREFIEQRGDAVKADIESCMTASEDGSTALDAQVFIAELVNDPENGITNARELLKIHRELRADYVHRFLRGIQSKEHIRPQNIEAHDMEVSDNDNEYRRNRANVLIEEVGKRSVNGLLTPADQQLIQHRAYSRVRHEQAEDTAA